VKVQDPGGRRWAVRRQWAPRLKGRGLRERLRRRRSDDGDGDRGWWAEAFDLVPFDIGADLPGIVLGVVLIVALVLFIVFVLGPLLLVLLDVFVVIALLVGGVVARLLFRRPWTVEAVAEGDGTELRFQAVGLAASRRLRDDVADRLARGQDPDDVRRT
jgi:hypothetical protein